MRKGQFQKGHKINNGRTPWNKGKRGVQVNTNKGKHWKIKDTSKMHHIAWNKGLLGFRKGHPASNLKSNSRSFKKGEHRSIKTEFKKGIRPWNKIGENGITPENLKIRDSSEYQLWRKSVLIRDNFTCQKYKIQGGILVAHHINNFADFPELRLAIDNGVTLSEKAHKEFHQLYGKRNNTKEQLLEFLSL